MPGCALLKIHTRWPMSLSARFSEARPRQCVPRVAAVAALGSRAGACRLKSVEMVMPTLLGGILEDAVEKQRMPVGESSKMAGRLNFDFATQYNFKRLGRAMIRPFYCQARALLKNGRTGPIMVPAK